MKPRTTMKGDSMKRLLWFALTLVLAIGLAACDNAGITDDDPDDQQDNEVASIVSILEDAGYELTEHDADARSYFSDNTIGDLGLDLDVTALYIGYLDGGAWVQVIEFESTTAAQLAAAAFSTVDETQYVYRDGNALMLTFTETTYDLFGE
jgi:hypothetical protein